MVVTIIIFVLILGLLIFVHEFGHFYAAKKSGMLVQEFGFGFPPRLFGVQKISGRYRWVWGHRQPTDPNFTVYSFNWIPLGGFVKILGENNEHEDHPGSFISKPFRSRFVTLVAGVVMNVMLAWVLTSVGFTIGLPTAVESFDRLPAGASWKQPQVAIVEVIPGLPAARAGIQAGDIILSVDGMAVTTLEQVRDYIKARAGQEFNFQIKRLNQNLEIRVYSKSDATEGPTGIVLANIGRLTLPWYAAIWEGAKTTVYQLRAIVGGLYQLVTSKVGLQGVGGPVKIAQLTGQVAHLGLVYVIQFTAFLSLNLAILNILPFPALDGGRVVFLLIEKIRGRRHNPKIEQIVNTVGFVFLLLLMVLVTIKDIKGF